MIIWREIAGFEGLYSISNIGQVKQVKYNRILKVNYCAPYPTVCLCKENKKRSRSVHRLLAVAFLPNPHNKPEINHKNGNKRDFSLDNLEWVTRSENCLHAYTTGLAIVSEHCKSIIAQTHSGTRHYNHKQVIDTTTGIIYDTIREAAKAHSIPVQTLHRYLHSQSEKVNLRFFNNK
jgi:hypothetical protein